MSASLANAIEVHHLHRKEPCKIALVGFGTVGSAVARLLSERTGEHSLRVSHVCNRAVHRKKVDWLDGVHWTDDIEHVLDSDADVLVELVGGIEPARDWVRRALQSGKSVVTANKQLIARHGAELMELARRHSQHLAFGACVAGGVPVLSALQEGLAGDRLKKVTGILNGTCNYILSRIEKSGASFAEALVEAQRAGFAEADPTDDVDGYDARAKLCVLAYVAFNANVVPEEIPCQSIRRIAKVDMEYADVLGCTIRQLSRVAVDADRLQAAVGPVLVSKQSPIASVVGSQNLVVSTGEFGGDTVFSGFGAGGNPTAVAVVSDLLQVARYLNRPAAAGHRAVPTKMTISGDYEEPHYVRFVVSDRPGILAQLATVFAKHELNIDAVLQRPGYGKDCLPFVVTLEPCLASRLRAALDEVAHFDFLADAPFEMPIFR